MNLVLFTHPLFLGQQSMPRFAKMLADGMKIRGHNVKIWSPQPRFSRLPVPGALRKWMGYIDQYIIFPIEVRRNLSDCHSDTLFVFADNALGPWVPLIASRPHVIHCHDFLAQKSALGQVPENKTKWTGRLYQAYIRRGYSRGQNFISVSNKTQSDLHQFLSFVPKKSEVVYNGLNQSFFPRPQTEARRLLGNRIQLDVTSGFLLHVGGNFWYKNRLGVIEIYDSWRAKNSGNIPLLLVGEVPSEELVVRKSRSPYNSDIHWLTGIEDEFVRLAYAGASIFLFPSIAEGFGWPIAEAMASGCLVITTDEAPMTEVAGTAGFFIPRYPQTSKDVAKWAATAAEQVDNVLNLSPDVRLDKVNDGLINARRFDPQPALDRIASLYLEILETTACDDSVLQAKQAN